MFQDITSDIFDALKLTSFIALDIETTGLDCSREDIIEFAAVHFHYGKIVDQTNFFVKPEKSIPEFITSLTGITNKDVSKADFFSSLLPDIQKFVQDYPIIAHNINFDLSFLEYHARKINNDFQNWDDRQKSFDYFPNLQIDTVALARLYLPFLNAFNLETLVKHFQLSHQRAHRALPDAEVAGRLFLELLKIALNTKFADIQKILQILEPTHKSIKSFFENLALCLASGKFMVADVQPSKHVSGDLLNYNILGGRDAATPSEKDLLSINENEIGAFFDEGGELANQLNAFEVRQPQIDMAKILPMLLIMPKLCLWKQEPEPVNQWLTYYLL